MLRLLVASSCVFAAAGAIAEPLRLTDADLKTTLAGALLEFDTPLGTTIPVRFFKNGLVSGKAGIMGPVLGADRDRGRWWVADDRLCVKWFRWFEAEKRCVVVVQEGARLHWSGASGRSGTAVIVERPQEAEVAAAPKAASASEPAAEPTPAEPKVETAATIQPPPVETKPADDDTARMQFAAAGAVGSAPFHLIPTAVAAPAPEASPSAPSIPPSSPSPHHAAPTPPAKAVTAAAAPAKAPRRPSSKPAPTALSSLVMRTSFRVAGVDEDDMLNVRSGPSELAETIGFIPPEGRGVKIVGACRDGWCPIVHGRTKGWVNGYYLAAEGTAPAQGQ